MQPEIEKLLHDMLESANDIVAFTAGKNFDDFQDDKQLRMAVERAFEILGEALTQIRKISPQTAEKISDSNAIIGFRNVLIHGYATVKNDITWDIVQTEVPTLRVEIEQLLRP